MTFIPCRRLPQRRSAFTMIEMLATIMLASTALLIAAKLARPLLMTARGQAATQEQTIRSMSFEHAIGTDIWNATTIDVHSAAELRLQSAGRSIDWTLSEGNATRQVVGEITATWEQVATATATFASSTPANVNLIGCANGESRSFISQPISVNRGGQR